MGAMYVEGGEIQAKKDVLSMFQKTAIMVI